MSKLLTVTFGLMLATPIVAQTVTPTGGTSPTATTEDVASVDAIITALLRQLLDMGITPRKFTQSRSLEKHFLEVTGGADS